MVTVSKNVKEAVAGVIGTVVVVGVVAGANLTGTTGVIAGFIGLAMVAGIVMNMF